MQKIHECLVRSAQTDLYCRVVGNGPPLIIVHGGPGLTMDYLFPHLQPLASRYTLIFYNQRGNEKFPSGSEPSIMINKHEMNIDAFTQDLFAIKNHFGHARVALLGHSWGAYLALAFAIKYPNQINQLIISNTIPLSSEELDPNDSYEKMIDDIVKSEAFKNNIPSGLIAIIENTFQHFFFRKGYFSKLNLEELSVHQLKKMALIHQLFEANFFHQPHDLYPDLANLNDIPVLIVHGATNDIPLAVAVKLSKSLKNSTLSVLDAGHFPFIELPDKFLRCIDEFNLENQNQYQYLSPSY